jgi:alanyl-tRNA synthetase
LDKVADALQCDAAHALAATVQLMDEVRRLKKDIAAGKAGEHIDNYKFQGEGPVADVKNYNSVRSSVREITRRLNVAISDVVDRLKALLGDRDRLVKELKAATAGGKLSADDLIASHEQVGDTCLIVAETPGANPNVMRGWIDQIRKKMDSPTAVLLAAVQGEKVVLVGGLSRDLVDRGLKAGDWVGATARAVGGGGGGRADMAQAGGKDPSQLPAALETARESMRQQISE